MKVTIWRKGKIDKTFLLIIYLFIIPLFIIIIIFIIIIFCVQVIECRRGEERCRVRLIKEKNRFNNAAKICANFNDLQ
jgi:hypothetical protein